MASDQEWQQLAVEELSITEELRAEKSYQHKVVSKKSYESIKFSSEFKKVTTSGVKFVTPFFIAFSLNSNSQQVKLGIIASRKVGCAVKRNRSKRLLRNSFSDNQTHLENTSIVLIARGAILNARYSDITNWMSTLAAKLMRKDSFESKYIVSEKMRVVPNI